MSKLTFHGQEFPQWGNQLWSARAKTYKLLDPPQQNPAPGIQCVGRMSLMSDEQAKNLVWQGMAGADIWWDAHYPFMASRPWVYAWELGPNEPHPLGDSNYRKALVPFTYRLAERAEAAGIIGVYLNFSVGWPDIGHAMDFAPLLPFLRFIGLHEYGWPSVMSGDGYWTLRYRRTVDEWIAGGVTAIPPILITECGIDKLLIGIKGGWQTVVNAGTYLDQLAQYDEALKADPYVQAAYIFTYSPPQGGWGWNTYHITDELAGLIINHVQTDPAPPPILNPQPVSVDPVYPELPTYPAIPIGDMAKGIDVSKYRGTIDWAAVKAAGYTFAIIRCVGPNKWPDYTDLELDPKFLANYAGCVANDILPGAFHFPVGNLDPVYQAAFVHNVLTAHPEIELPLLHWVDLEDWNLTEAAISTYLGELDEWLDGRAGIYSNANFLNHFGVKPWMLGRLRWVANWTNRDHPVLPDAWTTYDFWQHSNAGTVPGVPGHCDLNRFHGDTARLYEDYKPQEAEPMTDPIVHDRFGNLKTWAWAQSTYNISLIRAEPPEGATVARVVGYQEAEGPATMVVNVKLANGNPAQGVAMIQGWQDGPPLPTDAAPRLSPTWWAQPAGKNNAGNGGMTNQNGDIGWGWGTGEYYNPALGPGAHWYWAMPGGNQIYSDVALGHGMLPNTEHRHIRPIFQLQVQGPDPDPDPDPEPGDLPNWDAISDALLTLKEAVDDAIDAIVAELDV